MAIGFALQFLSKRQDRQARGTALMGLGLVFFGMSLMGDAMAPLRTSEAFIDAMARLENPFLGIAVAALFTGMVQSSSATTGVVIALAQQDLISVQTGIALILGANIGTAITAILAAVGKPRDAMRAAAAHTVLQRRRRADLGALHLGAHQLGHRHRGPRRAPDRERPARSST